MKKRAQRQRVVDAIEKLVQVQEEHLTRMERLLAPAGSESSSESELRCAMCGRSRKEVRQMVKGKYGAVCGECVKESSAILASVKVSPTSGAANESPTE